MNKKGQDHTTFKRLILSVAAMSILVILLPTLMLPFGIMPETERWQEEWQCTQWEETSRKTILIDIYSYSKIPEGAEKIECLESWTECIEIGDLNVDQRKENRCLDDYTDYCCLGEAGGCSQYKYDEVEKICVEKKPRQCLITRKKCSEHGYHNAPTECWGEPDLKGIAPFWKDKFTETRECDQEATK